MKFRLEILLNNSLFYGAERKKAYLLGGFKSQNISLKNFTKEMQVKCYLFDSFHTQFIITNVRKTRNTFIVDIEFDESFFTPGIKTTLFFSKSYQLRRPINLEDFTDETLIRDFYVSDELGVGFSIIKITKLRIFGEKNE